MSWNTFISSGGIRGNVIFADYAAALNHFQTVKPIRGRANDQRPLGTNRSTYSHCQIKFDPLTDGVSAYLYDTPCLSIYPTGRIEIRPSTWITPSTANFLEACIPSKFGSAYLSRRKIIYRTKATQDANGRTEFKEFVIPKNGVLVLQANSDWSACEVVMDEKLNPAIATQNYEYKADRKILNQIRKHYAGFLSTLDVMSAMSERYSINEICEYYPEVALRYVDKQNEYAEKERQMEEEVRNDPTKRFYPPHFNAGWEMRAVIESVGMPRMSTLGDLAQSIKTHVGDNKTPPWVKSHVEHIVQRNIPAYTQMLKDAESDDVSVLRKLMIGIAINSANYGHYAGGWGEDLKTETVPTKFGDTKVPSMFYLVSKTQMENFFIDAIKYIYADKIFKKVEVPLGTVPKTTNEKYVILNNFLLENSDIVTQRHSVPV